jgi:metal-dependent amidase/aminoacylase/carboxypeptidase family protein
MRLKRHVWRCVDVIILGAVVIAAAPAGSEERTMNDEIPERFERIVGGICEANRATYDLEYERIAPVVDNDTALTAFAAESLSNSLGAEHVLEVPPIMAAEDFAYFQREVPGVYFFLGVANASEGWTDYVHTPTFRPDESSIITGVTAAASLLADFTAADPVG